MSRDFERIAIVAQGSADQAWWGLHVRVARGEQLNASDQSIYDAALRELDDREALTLLADARQARAELRSLEAERGRLEQRRQQLDMEIAAFESALAPQARQLLSAEQ